MSRGPARCAVFHERDDAAVTTRVVQTRWCTFVTRRVPLCFDAIFPDPSTGGSPTDPLTMPTGLLWRISLIATAFFLINKFKQKLAPICFPDPEGVLADDGEDRQGA